METVGKAIALVLLGFLLVHWLTGGQQEIMEGPPRELPGSIFP